jgi:6,7-dimethyl-8-ribityllumazine synthase
VSEAGEGTPRVPVGVEPPDEPLASLGTIDPEPADASETAEPEVAEPEVDASEIAEPEVAEPEVAEPEIAEPEGPLEVAEEPPAAEHAEGELRLPEGVLVHEGPADDGRRSVGIVVSRFNGEITNLLLEGAMTVLDDAGVDRERIEVLPVPGAFELPLGAMALAKTRRFACVVALGCVIRGETPHFDFICSETASGLQLAGLETGVPVAFGVLTCESREQAEARAGGERGNKGADAARSALEMADVFARMRPTA